MGKNQQSESSFFRFHTIFKQRDLTLLWSFFLCFTFPNTLHLIPSHLIMFNINDLDEFLLEIVFRLLNPIDVRSCSSVCLRWYLVSERIEKNCLRLNYGIPPFRQRHSTRIVQIINRFSRRQQDNRNFKVYKVTTPPISIENGRLLSSTNKNFLRTIKTLILTGNDRFEPDKSFSFELLSNVAHLEIRDQKFCNCLIRQYRKERFVCSSIEYLVLKVCTLELIACFPNLVYLEVINFRSDLLHRFHGVRSTGLKYFIMQSYLNESIYEFLMTNCMQLEHLDVTVNSDDQLAICHLLNNLKRLRDVELNFNFKSSSELIRLLGGEHLNNRYFKLVINHIETPTFDTFEHQLTYLQSTVFYAYNDSCVLLNQLGRIANDERPNFNKLKYYETTELLKIHSNEDVRLYNGSADRFENLDQLIIHDIRHSPHPTQLSAIHLGKLSLRHLKGLCLYFNYSIDQQVLNSIPECFPYLHALNLLNEGDRSYDFDFLTTLTYLSRLNLHYVFINDIQHLRKAIAVCNYFTSLHIVTSPNRAIQYRNELKQQFELKSSNHSIDFVLNGLNGMNRLNGFMN